MPDVVAPYYVLPDANIWIAERLLQSAIGSAFLYSVTRAKSSILLPEVVELDVGQVLPKKAEEGVSAIKRELSLLQQLSGHDLRVDAPSQLAIQEGIQERWNQLSGLLVRLPFTHDQAKSALLRVVRGTPPCGKNNEQFRDCCIWEAAVSMSTDRVVHVVTGDTAFYENRDKAAGLASALRNEPAVAKKHIQIHPSLDDFLAAADAGAATVDEESIGDGITKAILNQAQEIAVKPEWMRPGVTFRLGKAHRPKISGYATPKPSLVAISFETSFDLEATIVEHEMETQEWGKVTLKGECSYDPITKELLDIEITAWSKNLGNWMVGSADKTAAERQYGPGRMRLIS
jgi:PIN domain